MEIQNGTKHATMRQSKVRFPFSLQNLKVPSLILKIASEKHRTLKKSVIYVGDGFSLVQLLLILM